METESTKQRLIYRFGERAGIGIIAIFAIIFLSFQSPELARSQEQEEERREIESREEEVVEKPQVSSILNHPQIIVTSTNTPTPDPTATPQPTKTQPSPIQVAAPTPTSSPPPSTPTPTHTPQPTQAPNVDPSQDAVWDELAKCESGGNWAIDTGNGYYGGLQFSQSAWESVDGTGNPAHASREEQIMRGKMLQERRGWGAWGMCAVRLGLN